MSRGTQADIFLGGEDNGKIMLDCQCWTDVDEDPTSVTFRGSQPEMTPGGREPEEQYPAFVVLVDQTTRCHRARGQFRDTAGWRGVEGGSFQHGQAMGAGLRETEEQGQDGLLLQAYDTSRAGELEYVELGPSQEI